MPTARIVEVDSVDQARLHVEAWRELHAVAVDANVFLGPDFLLPLVEHGGADYPLRLVFVYGAGGERMIGCAVFGEPAMLSSLGPSALGTWDHPHFLNGTPLLDRTEADAAAAALLTWLDDPARPWSMVRWDRIGLSSSTWQHLEARARARGRRWWVRHSFRRAEMRCRESFGDFLAELSSKRRGKLRWRMNRLEKEGDLEVRLHRDLRDPGIIDRFLELEAAGWKGDAGTAMACDPNDETFFREAGQALAAAGELYFLELVLDGRPVAITANYRAGGTVFLFKSAYDPERSKLSPGIVNILHLTRVAHEDPEVQRLDSCASEDSHLEEVWRGAFDFGEALMATGAFSGLAVSALPWMRQSKDLVERAVEKVKPGAA